MRILVIGLGALGGVFATLLKKDGHHIAALDRAETVNAISDRLVRISGIWGDHESRLDELASNPEKLSGNYDLAILTVKSFNTREALEGGLRLIDDSTRVILAQNGYGNYEAAQNVLPRNQLIVGRVIFGAQIVEPGHSKVTVIADDVILGQPDGEIPEAEVKMLAETINHAGIPCRASTAVMQFLWGKILYNSALNSLGAILEVNYGTLAGLEWTRQTMNAVIDEIFSVLAAMKQPMPWDESAYRELFYTKLIPPTANHFPSMLQDIQSGRRTEIDFLNGAVVALGKEFEIPTPVNETVTQLVKAKEQLVAKPANPA